MGDVATMHPPPGAGIPALRYRSCLNSTGNLSLAFCVNETVPGDEIYQQSLEIIQKTVAIVVPLLFGLIVFVGLIGNALVSNGRGPCAFSFLTIQFQGRNFK
jgi:hypothetical protein